MKTILLGLYIFMPVLLYAQKDTKIIAVDIRGIRCQGGSGLCSTIGESSKIMSSPYIVKATANSIFLWMDTTTTKSEENIDFFVQEADFILDKNTLFFLGIEPKWHTLKKGKYPIIREESALKIVLPLTEL